MPTASSSTSRSPAGTASAQSARVRHGSNCNQKLIGAQWFNAARAATPSEAGRPWEFMSARDYNGHGTHTASDRRWQLRHADDWSGGRVFGPVTGMAPRARIAVYKALWSTQDASTASGATGDLVAAIDQAVADGVDVINYSISGTSTNFADPVEIAYFFAANAGIFVSESAGNSGPTTSTVAHPSPWTTTVAAGTHNRNGIGSVRSATASPTTVRQWRPVGPAPLDQRDRRRARPAQRRPRSAMLLAPAQRVALRARSSSRLGQDRRLRAAACNARVDKSAAVLEAGGVGMILVNVAVNSINADFHFVPTVHLQHGRSSGQGLRRDGRCHRDDQPVHLTYSDPAPFTAASRRAARSSRVAATCSSRTSSRQARTSLPRSRLQATTASTSTCTAARRCRRLT